MTPNPRHPQRLVPGNAGPSTSLRCAQDDRLGASVCRAQDDRFGAARRCAQDRFGAARLPLYFLFLVLLSAPLHAQLPAGTTDTTAAPRNRPDPLRTQAAEALERRDYAAAQKLLTTLTEHDSKDATLLYDLGFADESLNDEPAAAVAYNRSVVANPGYFEPRLALGLLLAREGKVTEAHAELSQAVTLETPEKDLKARAYRALARLDQPTDPGAAGADLIAALKLSPESVDDALLAGELAEAARDSATAEASYRRILSTHADDPAITAALAHLLLTLKRAPEAETLLKAALATHPDGATLTSQLAATYAAQDRSPEAIALVEKLHAAAPTDRNLTLLLAHLYSDNKQDDLAGLLYTALLAATPQDARLLADLGETELRLHHYPEAERLLQQATADPKAFTNSTDLANTVEKLAFAASHNNDPQTVLQALSQRATVLPQSPASLFLAATAHDTLHHRKEASALYKQFLAAAAGNYPDQEWEASHRLIALEHRK